MQLTLTGDDQMRVQVQTINADGTYGAWSDAVPFKFTTASAGPVAPTVTAPTPNQLFTNYPRTMTVTWAPDGQPKHNIEVTCDICSSATTKWLDPTTYSIADYVTSYPVPALAGDNQFRVRVQAVNSDTVAGAWSEYVYFSFKTPPAQAQTYVTMDYTIWGTTNSGQITISPTQCDAAKCGYNFSTNAYTAQGSGAFYSLVQSGVMAFWGNNVGQGGTVKLANADVTPPPVGSTQYNTQAVPIELGGWYAINDLSHERIIRVHVTNIVTQ